MRLKRQILIAVSFVAVVVAISSVYSEDPFIKLRMVEVSSRQFDFFVDNMNYCPYQLQVRIPLPEGFQATTNLPYRTIVRIGETNRFLFSVFTTRRMNIRPSFDYNAWFGDPAEANPTEGLMYVLPFEDNTSHRMTQGYDGGFSHSGWVEYSLDFSMDINTPVCAARNGVVVAVKSDSSVGGGSRRYRGKANFITLYHSDGTFTQYHHLRHNGSAVKVGDHVEAGQVIGFSGSTGWSTGPHLHFMAYKPVNLGEQTFPTLFVGSNVEPFAVRTRKTYVSYHYTNMVYNVAKNTQIDTNRGAFLANNTNVNSETNYTGGY
jgi:murein DD-endopeptidase MepM/ murein hydrolase activator NlpD